MSRLLFSRLTAAFAFSLLVALAIADIQYVVTPMPDVNKLKVQMVFDARPGPFELQMPNWAPGAYFFNAFGRNVADFALKDDKGAIAFEKIGDDTWKVASYGGGRVMADYTVPCQMVDATMHYSGPSTYLYIVGRKEEDCKLDLNVARGWGIAVGLDGSGTEYHAPNYDVLADNPVTMGNYIELTYSSRGKPHIIALRGAPKSQVDQNKILDVCKHVTESQADFFGGLPYNKYVWHFNVTPGQDGGGGLEHLSSTQITLAAGVGPGSVRVISHEFFHLWNVKRIRSKVLGPFDYTQLPKTGALYWLEGVTDYYASLLLLRYGWMDEAAFHNDLIRNLNSVRSNPARLEVSPYESSMRVGETNNGRGNSNGWRISYYNLGWLVGLCLDIELRAQTQGRRSLDDVTRALWQLCRDPNKPGFEEDEIRKQCVRFGGPAMGEFFDKVVMKAGELPIEEQLKKVGLELAQVEESFVDPQFDFAPIFGGGNGVRIARVRGGAETSGLIADDVVLEVNGASIASATSFEALGKANTAVRAVGAGTALKLKIRRAGEEKEFSVTPIEAKRSLWKVIDGKVLDPEKLALRKGWYYAGKKK